MAACRASGLSEWSWPRSPNGLWREKWNTHGGIPGLLGTRIQARQGLLHSASHGAPADLSPSRRRSMAGAGIPLQVPGRAVAGVEEPACISGHMWLRVRIGRRDI